MRHPIVYIVGAMAAHNGLLREHNVRRAEAYILPLAVEGITSICPHSMCRFLSGTLDEHTWRSLSLEYVHRADALLCPRIGDVKSSEGTRGEVKLAKKLGKPVFSTMEQVRIWLKDRKP